MSMRVAVVMEDADSRALVVACLSAQGFEAMGLEGERDLRAVWAASPPDCVIQDLALTREQGLAMLRWIRQVSDVPVLVLTDDDVWAERLAGMRVGAVRCLCKPVPPAALLAELHAVLRRQPVHAIRPLARMPVQAIDRRAAPQGDCWFGAWRLDRELDRLVGLSGEVLDLTPSERALLRIFADHPRVPLSVQRLIELSAGDPASARDAAIELRMARLRRKIEPGASEPSVLRSVQAPVRGYEFCPSIEPLGRRSRRAG